MKRHLLAYAGILFVLVIVIVLEVLAYRARERGIALDRENARIEARAKEFEESVKNETMPPSTGYVPDLMDSEIVDKLRDILRRLDRIEAMLNICLDVPIEPAESALERALQNRSVP